MVMKVLKNRIVLATALSLVTFSLNAQILVQEDGGVRIGTPHVPSSGITIGTPTWQLSTKGLEVSVGDILFHTANGNLRFVDFRTMVGTSSGGIAGQTYVNATAITGSNLSIGMSSQYAFRVYANEIYSSSSQKVISDRRYKDNIVDLEDATAKVLQLRPVSFDLKTPENYAGDTMALKGKVGFIAQEVQELFPNLVGYLPDADQYVLDYTSFIPYLTQSIQRQAQQIEEQEERIAELEMTVEMLLTSLSDVQTRAPQVPVTGSEGANLAISHAKLYQNIPNPFSGTTEIRYELPEDVRSASVEIHTAAGQKVESRVLPLKPGAGTVFFESRDFATGTHVYSLIVDGQLVSTKRMVVSE